MAHYWSEIYAYLVRPVAIYLAALLMVRLMGKRALGQLSLFDLVVMAGIGDVIVVVGLERRVPVLEGLVVLGIFGALEILLSLLTYRWGWAASLFEGQPAPLIRDGRFLRENMQREHISRRDLAQELRKQGIDDHDKVKEAVLEACGKISVIPKEELEDSGRILAELTALRQEISSLDAKIEELRKGAR